VTAAEIRIDELTRVIAYCRAVLADSGSRFESYGIGRVLTYCEARMANSAVTAAVAKRGKGAT
jgi:hypothetical protein